MTATRLITLAAAAALFAGPALAEDKIILLINPNSNAKATESMAELASMEAGDGIRVEARSNEGAPALLTTPEDMQNAIPGVVQIGVDAVTDQKVAAIIVSAFSDPGLEELRAAVDVPVFGIGESVFHEAAEAVAPSASSPSRPTRG
jgi:Asp/Glu/hydantoin racemase